MSLVLVDTSIWIDALGKSPRLQHPPDFLSIAAVCPPIVQEILQGIGDEVAHARARLGVLALPCVGEPIGIETWLHASEIYRLGRQRGLTIRSSTDCLIAAVALESKLPLWAIDRDYAMIARYTNLQLYQPTAS